MIDFSKYLGRTSSIFTHDLFDRMQQLKIIHKNSSILVLGGAGSIGSAVCKTLLSYNPRNIDIVDLSENNLVELTRDIRSSDIASKTKLRFICLDVGSQEFDKMFSVYGPYDYVYNLTALKHVRSEENQFTLIRMLQTNVINAVKAYKLSKNSGVKSYFCVSTDKAADPTNVMGATKLLMEKSLNSIAVPSTKIVLARFANVLFSDGSLPFGFQYRLQKNQPLSAPSDIRRYFISEQEAGELCVLSGSLGQNSEIFFPKMLEAQDAQSFTEVAKEFLKENNYRPKVYETEEAAKRSLKFDKSNGFWPCYFFKSNTSGEKYLEEFYTNDEVLNMDNFQTIGIIKPKFDDSFNYENFYASFMNLSSNNYKKEDILDLIKYYLANFKHVEKNASLNARM
ncbi:polysaccharide biosynthesis protein [Amylibacter sp.]|nr:polysaccharide biosynthesis protein [Amylibacter sp.]